MNGTGRRVPAFSCYQIGLQTALTDLNIIENVWGFVQEKVESRGCSSFEEFRDAVKEEMAAVPGKLITNLFKSLPQKMQLVVSNGGQKIGY